MSRESVEVVEAAWAALASGGLDAFAEYWADDIEWRAIGGRWRGKDAGRAYLQERFDLFDDVRFDVIELIDAADERVVTVLRYKGRERRSGVEIPPEHFAIVNRIRDGKIVSGREYSTREEAIEAARIQM